MLNTGKLKNKSFVCKQENEHVNKQEKIVKLREK